MTSSKFEEGDSPDPELDARISDLEQKFRTKQRTSLAARVSQWMALVALIISIAVGGFQVYDNTILRKQEKIAKTRTTFADYVRKITEINSRLVSFQFSTSSTNVPKPPTRDSASRAMAVKALTQVLNVEKMSIIDLADNLIMQNRNIASYAGLIALSLEHLNWGNIGRSRMYTESALGLAKNQIEKVEARRIQALTWFAPSPTQNISMARELFSKAMQSLDDAELMRAGLIANVYRDWISAEAVFGNCDEGKQLLKHFEETMRDENNGWAIWNTAMEEIFRSTLRSDCNLYSQP